MHAEVAQSQTVVQIWRAVQLLVATLGSGQCASLVVRGLTFTLEGAVYLRRWLILFASTGNPVAKLSNT